MAEICAIALMVFMVGMIIGYEWGKQAGLRIGRIIGAVDRDREIRAKMNIGGKQ